MEFRRLFIILLFSIYVLLVLGLTTFSYFTDKQRLYEEQNSSLYTAASSLDTLLEPGFHDRYTLKNPMSDEDYRELVARLNTYTELMEVEFVYSMVMMDESIFFVVSNETEDDIRRDTPSLFYNYYPDPPEILYEVFKAEKIVFYSTYTNKWDSFYSIFLPRRTDSGLVYVLAADIKLVDKMAIFQNRLLRTIIIVILLLIPLIPIYWAMRRISKAREKELLRRIYVDSLTGLPNRDKFVKDCREDFPKGHSALMFDIDAFHDLNNLFGGTVGDFVLTKVAGIIGSQCAHCDTLYKFPADEFVVLSCRESKEELQAMAKSVLKAVSNEDFYSDAQPLDLTLSCGIVYQPDNEKKLLAAVNIAKNTAKSERRGIAFYNKSLNLERHYERNYFQLNQLKEALKDNRIIPYYQPIFDNETGQVAKYEALVRLIDKQGNIVLPGEFLEVAKRSKLYKEISRTMIERVLSHFSEEDKPVSLNMTVNDLIDKETMTFLFDKVREYGMENRVIVELVESESLTDQQTAIEMTKKFHEMNILVAIDDFGSGYSNFDYLGQIHADFIKIDGSLIINILENKLSESLVSAISGLGSEMGIETIAEYVNSDEILNKVKALGISCSQGYGLGMPEPYEKIVR